MAVVLDTSGLPPGRRADAVAEVIRFSSSVPTRVVYNCPDDEVSARFEYFTFGDARLLTSQNSSQGLITTPALLKGAQSDLLVVSVKLTGTATLTQAPGRQLRSGDLFVTDLWRPFEFVDQGGTNAAFYVGLDRLGLSRDYAARAGQALHLSPMAAQLQRHFQILLRDADAISQSPAASMIGQATTDLVRAALVAGVDEEPFRSDGWERNLIAVAKSYISQHLAEPFAAIAFKDDKAPGKELAMIGRARAGLEDGGQLFLGGAGLAHRLGRAGAAAQKQIQGMRGGQVETGLVGGHFIPIWRCRRHSTGKLKKAGLF